MAKKNFEKVRKKFATQMLNPFMDFWLYDNEVDDLVERDLGYYVGYTICENYYERATDKKKAIKEMIELDYNTEIALKNFVDKSGYFNKPINKLKSQFEISRPTVVNIKQFKNGDNNVNPNLTQITIEFSNKMDKRFRNFEFGPLGEKNVLRVKKYIGFSEDGKSVSFEIELKPNQQYQIIIADGFRTDKAISLKPYLLNIKTADN